MFKRLWVPTFLTVIAITGVLTSAVVAEDAYYHLSLGDLELTEGSLPETDEANWGRWWNTRNRPAYAVLDGEGEVYVHYLLNTQRLNARNERTMEREIAIRVPQARTVTGKIYLPKWNAEGMQVATFKIAASQAEVADRQKFYELKLKHYEDLLAQRQPGAAWFRHEARQAREALGNEIAPDADNAPVRQQRPRTDELSDTFAMFSGGKAMSENLQLDRVLQPASGGDETVALSSLEGITVREIDWKPLIEGLHPELDPLAFKIPADQHAIFYPSFNAALAMSDELAQQGASVLQWAEPRSTSARTFERYQQQMCLAISTMARLLGPTVAKSVAVTGSDPYFRTGTDVAVLFETDDAALLEQLLLAQIGMTVANNKSAKPIAGEINGLAYRGVRSDDRSVCSYVAKLEGLVIVTNSPFQLQQLVQVTSGKSPSLAALDEFIFFRDRYARGDEGETAFLFLSDAAIRRWCGPRWRIATSRRTRDAAVLAELQASQLDRLVQGEVTSGPLYTDLPLGGDGEITLDATGVHCSSIGSLAFMTPISEMAIEKATQAEAEAYRRWRTQYQSNWRWAFDPIGLRLRVDKRQLAADLTVMPLIWASDYREVISYSQGAAFAADAGDRHATLAHVIMAINTDSPQLKRQTNMLQMLTGNVTVEPLSWLGNNVSVYVDNDPFWDEIAKVSSDEISNFMRKQGWRVPFAVRADVSSGLKLTLFLGAVRAFIEQASPGMLNWETLTYNDQPYVKITATERAIGQAQEFRDLAIYYSASGKSLTLTLNEDLLKRAIDRETAPDDAQQQGQETPGPDRGWLGSNLALQVDQRILQVLASAGRDQYQRAMQNRAWSNLAILNEWKQRYSDQDPVALHEQFWQDRLLCPGGGEYVWNAQCDSMESTMYGCPAAPKIGPPAPPLLQTIQQGNFGITFEEQGLRARVELTR